MFWLNRVNKGLAGLPSSNEPPSPTPTPHRLIRGRIFFLEKLCIVHDNVHFSTR